MGGAANDRLMRTTLLIGLASCALLVATDPGAVPITVPSLIVSDRNADPLSRGDLPGGLFIMRYGQLTTFIASAAQGFRDPEGIAIRPDRLVYVADSGADPLGLADPRGAIWLVDPAARFDSEALLVAASALFVDPVDLLLESDGHLLVVDPNADPFERGFRRGAVFRVDPTTGNVEVLSASTLFSDPQSLAWDRDGTVLILDRSSDPLGRGIPSGALLRMQPSSGAVVTVKAFDGQQTRRPMAVAVLPDGDYAIVDQDADPTNSGVARGAIFRLRKETGQLEPLVTSESLLDPVDVAMGIGNEIWVLDRNSDFDRSPATRGGSLGFDLVTGALLHAQAHPFLREPSALAFASGPAIDSTKVTWTDDTGGLLQPGDLVTFRATIKSRGTRDALGVTLTDSLAGTWLYVAGSDSATRGQVDYESQSRVLRWTGNIPVGQDATIQFRLRLDPSLGAGAVVRNQVSISVDGAPNFYEFRGNVESGIEEGTVVFVDRGLVQGQNGGFIFRVEPNSTNPGLVYAGADLEQPLDAVFLEDGRLAILDRAAVPVEGVNGAHAVLIYSGAAGALHILWTREREDGLVDPQGIGLDLDGNLLLVDREANPFDLEYQPDPGNGDFGPGAVYKIDIVTGIATPLFSDARMREPIAVGVDGRGIVIATDFTGTNGNGDAWEYDPTTRAVTRRPVNETWFRDPLGFALDAQDNMIVADLTHFNDATDGTDNGTLFKINRANPTTYQILSQSALLVDPADCWADGAGTVYITDRDANPLGLQDNDPGAVFRYDTRLNQLTVATAAFGLDRPVGPAGYSRLQVNAGVFELTDLDGGDLEGGDSLQVVLQVVNASRRSAPAVFLDLGFSSHLHLLSLTANRPGAGFDPEDNRGSWAGAMARADTVICTALVRVDPEVAFGEVAELVGRLYYGTHSSVRELAVPLRGGFLEGEVLLVDEAADPDRHGNSGAIFRARGASGSNAQVVLTGPPLIDPSAVEFAGDGTLLVADRRGVDSARLYRLETASGTLVSILPDNPDFRTPSDLLFAPDGDLLIVDRDAPSEFPEAKGAVYRLSGMVEPLELFSSSPAFRSPSELAYDAAGRLFLCDRAANPDTLSGNSGAVFELDPEDGTVLRHFQFAEMPEPTGVSLGPGGKLLITDTLANPRSFPGPHGTLFTLDQDAGEIAEFLVNASLIRPYRSHLQLNGKVLIIDQSGAAPGQAGSPGTIHEYDPIPRTLRNYARSDSFRSLSDLTERPTSLITLQQYELTDTNGVPLYPADRLSISARARNIGAVRARAATFADTIPAAGQIVSGTISASSGTVTLLGNVVLWQGDLEPAQAVEISYQVQLDPFLAEGKILQFKGTAAGPTSAPVSLKVSRQVFVPLEGGHLYLADSAADPFQLGTQPGAIFKVDQRTGETIVYATYPQSREPIDVVIAGTTIPRLYIADQLHIERAPARGGVFEIDPFTLESRLLAADSTWFRLEDILALSDDELLVLDGFADPFGLTPGVGPGALYRVSLPAGEVELLYSDTTLVNPRAMTLLPDGRVAIVDAETDPLRTGRRAGGVYIFDLDSRELELLAGFPLWVDPSDLAVEDDQLLVVDQSASPDPSRSGVGSVWRVSLTGLVSLMSVSDYFRRLGSIVVPIDGRTLLSDLDATIGTGSPNGGAILRWSHRSSSQARFFPLAANNLLVQPQGMSLYQDVTPIVVLPFAAVPGESGITLEWEGLSEPEDARYLLYRRQAEGPDDSGEDDDFPSGYGLVSTTEEFRGRGPHRVIDTSVEAGGWYVYRIAIAYRDGTLDFTPPQRARAPLSLLRFALFPGRPNPFATGVEIMFTIPRSDEVRLTIHDVAGRRVRELVDEEREAGRHLVAWDGRDQSGRRLPAGIYFARLQQRAAIGTQRLVLLR